MVFVFLVCSRCVPTYPHTVVLVPRRAVAVSSAGMQGSQSRQRQDIITSIVAAARNGNA